LIIRPNPRKYLQRNECWCRVDDHRPVVTPPDNPDVPGVQRLSEGNPRQSPADHDDFIVIEN
jgi:hypothetical protein